MGNQTSSEKGGGGKSKYLGPDSGPSLDSYPSFSKSDTKESSRSFRGTIRSKIRANSDSTDSPRASVANLLKTSSSNSDNDNSIAREDTLDSRDGDKDSDDPTPRGSQSRADSPVLKVNGVDEDDDGPAIQPPPSPTQSASVGRGHDVDKAQRSGEVGNVSDAPPTGGLHPSGLQKPKESILMKKDVPKPRARSRIRHTSSNTDGAMDINSINLDEVIQRLLDAGYAGKVTKTVCLKNAEIQAICHAARELFLSQPSLLELSPPVKIVGDIHGQYTDLLRMFEMCGFPPNSNFLFLGDYVDRGKQSLETILLLLCYKLKFPENFFLLRGNHESANVTRVYGFYDECKRRTTIKIWKGFIDTFNALPIASIVANKIFCVHGGLSPSLTHMDDIRNIARPTDVPDYGLLNDLLWSDPAEIDTEWEASERGVSYCFGKKVIMDFLQKHDMDLVCRAHMVVEDGYEFFTDRVLVTVFSAPNVSRSTDAVVMITLTHVQYCGEFDNWGAVMAVSGELLCSFELIEPLDSSALKNHIKKGRRERMNMINSPVRTVYDLRSADLLTRFCSRRANILKAINMIMFTCL